MKIFTIPKNINTEYITHRIESIENDENEYFYINEILKSDLPEFVKKSICSSINRIEPKNRPEILFFNNLIKIVNSDIEEINFKLQYKILNYRVDCFIDEKGIFNYKNCYIIEYDEFHHEQENNKKKDNIRIENIIRELKKEYKEICVIRVKEKYHYECLKYLIPFFSKFDCYCLDIAIEKKYLEVKYYDNNQEE